MEAEEIPPQTSADYRLEAIVITRLRIREASGGTACKCSLVCGARQLH